MDLSSGVSVHDAEGLLIGAMDSESKNACALECVSFTKAVLNVSG